MKNKTLTFTIEHQFTPSHTKSLEESLLYTLLATDDYHKAKSKKYSGITIEGMNLKDFAIKIYGIKDVPEYFRKAFKLELLPWDKNAREIYTLKKTKGWISTLKLDPKARGAIFKKYRMDVTTYNLTLDKISIGLEKIIKNLKK